MHLDKPGMKIEKTREEKKREIFQLNVAFIKPKKWFNAPSKRVGLNQNENFRMMIFKDVIRRAINILLLIQHKVMP